MLLDGCCPLCHEYLLRRGPEGGLSINVRCDKCEAVWNIGVGATMCALLKEPGKVEQEQTEDTERVLVEKDVSSSEGAECGLVMKDQTNIQSQEPGAVSQVTNSERLRMLNIMPGYESKLREEAAAWLAEEAAQGRAHEESGFVIFYRGRVAGWTCDLREMRGWLADCYAVPRYAEENVYLATGGDEQSGAERWEPVEVHVDAPASRWPILEVRRLGPVVGRVATYLEVEERLGDGSGEVVSAKHPAQPVRLSLGAMMRAQREEVKGAKEGLHRLVTWALENRFCSTAEIIRSVLLSLYNSRPCDLAAVQQLDRVQRRALGALVLGMGIDGGVYDHEIRDAFALEGSINGLTWFLKPLRPPKDFVQGCLHSALERASGDRKAVVV